MFVWRYFHWYPFFICVYNIYRKYTDLHSFWFYQRLDSQLCQSLIHRYHPFTSAFCQSHGGVKLTEETEELRGDPAPVSQQLVGSLLQRLPQAMPAMVESSDLKSATVGKSCIFFRKCPEFKECKHEMFMWFQVDIGSCSCCFCSLFLFTFFLVFFPCCSCCWYYVFLFLLSLLLIGFLFFSSFLVVVVHLPGAAFDACNAWRLILSAAISFHPDWNHHFCAKVDSHAAMTGVDAMHLWRPYQNIILKSGEKWWLCCVFFHLQDFADLFSSNLNQKLEVTLLTPFTMCVRQTCWCFLSLHRLLRSCELTPEATGNIVSSIFEEARLE